jgi:uncharacterized protein (DUF2147 family)
MKNRSFALPLSAFAAALFVACGPSKASTADPSGIWVKDDGSAKVEIKKCGRGLCGEVVWLRNPNDSRGRPLHDARNENPSLRDRPIIGLPLFSNMRPTELNTWVGNVYNPVEGHIYTDVKVTLVSRQQIVLRGCKTWLLCGEKTWTRSHLPPVPAVAETPIEVKAPVEPGATDKAKPTSPLKPQAPLIEASGERETPSAPGFAFVTTPVRWEPQSLSGSSVSSMIAMARPSTATATALATATASLTETRTTEEQWPWLQRRSVRLASTRTEAQAKAAPAAPIFVKQKPKPVALAEQEQWPWLPRRPRTGAQVQAPASAASNLTKPTAKPVVKEAQEQWPWLQRRSVLLASSRTGE